MTVTLEYFGTWRKGQIKLVSAPGHDGKDEEVILDSTNWPPDPTDGSAPLPKLLTVSTAQAEVILARYPTAFRRYETPSPAVLGFAIQAPYIEQPTEEMRQSDDPPSYIPKSKRP